ncbi:L-histidine N(alpha)-methyltransferase [Cytophagaceae bacterium ABcell3]|nr:L-histidine N(alpha)-methyltransferase [Cytophagaceae bacterium ABcell3]
MKIVEKELRERNNEAFALDVLKGLSQVKKSLPSKYLYNHKGDALFRRIMNLEEYYPTRCEAEILENHVGELARFLEGTPLLQLVDLGAGDGYKTKIVIRHFLEAELNLKYTPIDISRNCIDGLLKNVKDEFPSLKGEGIVGDYFQGLKSLRDDHSSRKLVFFLGSNIGNFSLRDAYKFLRELHNSLNPGDLLLIGFDLKKDPRTIIRAYDDSEGVTAEFNKNLLKRINEELGSTFDLEAFDFYPFYNPDTGELSSYLVSNKDQNVFIEDLGRTFFFSKWETVHTECSNKYGLNDIERIADGTGFGLVTHYFDSKQYFVDSLWQVE